MGKEETKENGLGMKKILIDRTDKSVEFNIISKPTRPVEKPKAKNKPAVDLKLKPVEHEEYQAVRIKRATWLYFEKAAFKQGSKYPGKLINQVLEQIIEQQP